MAGQVNVLPQMLKNGVARYINNVLVDKDGNPIPVGGGANAYLYKAYASAADGTGFSLTPSAGLYFVALKRTTSPIASPVVGDFAGLWLDTRGAAGAPGASSYKYRAFASAADGTGFTLTDNPALVYVAEINTTSPIASPVLGDFAGLFVKRIGQDGASAYKYRAFASAADGADFTLMDNPALAYVAEINTTFPIGSPVLGDFAGLFVKRIGTDGLTGSQGDRAGHRYAMAISTNMAKPGAGLVRFNSADASLTTHIAMDAAAKNGISLVGEMATWMINDILTFRSNSNAGSALSTFKINAITYNEATTWYDFTVQYINGARPANSEEIVVNYAAGGVRVDENGNLRDPQGNIISGVPAGTHAEMLALNPADFNREYFHTTDYGVGGDGIRYRCNGTFWLADGDQLLFNDFINFQYVAPAAQASGAIANNGARVQITATAHLLTQAIAVTSAGVPGAKVSISAWSGTGVPGFYKVYSVDGVNAFTIDLAYNAALGLPTLVLAGTEIIVPFTVNLPPLNDNSEILYEPEYVYTGSANNKYNATYLGAAKLSRPNNTTANSVFARALLGFRNVASKSVQETMHGETSINGTGSMTSSPVTAAIDTSVQTGMSFRMQPQAANEIIGLKHLTVRLRG